MYVFDLDGTLINSTARHYVLMERLVNAAGWEISANFAQDYMDYKACGNNGRLYLENKLHIPNALASSIQDAWVKGIECEEMLKLDVLYSDTIPTLEYLKSNYSALMFLTMRHRQDLLHEELYRLGISKYPDKVIVLSPGGKVTKADILKQLDCSVDYVIGDTETDYEAAKQVGAKSCMLHRGFRNKTYWNNRNVTTYDSLLDFIKLVK